MSVLPTESNINMTGAGLVGKSTSGAGKSSRMSAADVRSLCSVYSTSEVDTLLAGYQPLDSDLTAIAALTTTSFGRSLLTQADAATARTTLGAGTGTIGGTVGATDNRLVRSDGTGAATVQSTGITVDDSNNVSGVGTINATPKVEVIFSGTTPATPAYGSIALVGTTFSASPYIGGGLCSDRLQGLWFPDGVPVMGTRTTLAAGATFTTWLAFGSTIGVGGQTSSFPGFNASGTTFRIRLADNSADAPLSAGAITASGQLTNAQGTLTASAPLTLTQTWNNAAVAFNGMLINVTDTASSSTSLLADLQVAGTSIVNVRRAYIGGTKYSRAVIGLTQYSYITGTSGGFICFGTDESTSNVAIDLGVAAGIRLASGSCVSHVNDSSNVPAGTVDLSYGRDSAGVFGIYTSTAKTTKGALTCGAITSSALMCAGAYTVATLPSASANAGKFAQVTDSSVTTFGSTVSGGGSNRVPVFSNGTNWVVA